MRWCEVAVARVLAQLVKRYLIVACPPPHTHTSHPCVASLSNLQLIMRSEKHDILYRYRQSLLS